MEFELLKEKAVEENLREIWKCHRQQVAKN
jgi:hypothetical protein